MSVTAEFFDYTFDYPVADGAQIYARAWRDGWRAPVVLPLSEWSDSYRVLPREGASEYGRWRTERTPFLKEIMDVLSPDHKSKRVVFMKGVQVGGTEVGLNWIGSIIHQTPGPAMAIQPTSSMAKRWSKQRLQPMIDVTKELRECVQPARSRDSGNTTLMKEYPGGVLVICGANSAAELRSMPVKYLFADEVDGYPDDVDGEGSPLSLAEKRTNTFPRRKILIVSTPTIKDASVIEYEYSLSDQRKFYLPCPLCDHKQVLRDEGLTDDGQYLCESCGGFIQHHQKTRMLERGEWIAGDPDSDVPGFHLPALYAPVGLGLTWLEIANERRKARDNDELLQTYKNTLLGETYEDERGKIDWQELQSRAGNYKSREIPEGCLILTAGVDTQPDRLAITIWGWGRKERRWLIDWVELPGDPEAPEVWEALDKLLDAKILNKFNIPMKVQATCIDSGGHNTHAVYNYCRNNKTKRRYAIKGMSYGNRPIIAGRPSPQDLNYKGKTLKDGVDLWRVGSDTAKGALFARLNADGDKESDEQQIRFPNDLNDDFYMQLTAERYDAKNDRWKKLSGRRNEALDCTDYAHAAAVHPAIRVHMMREIDWQKLEEKFQPVIDDLFSMAAQVDAQTEAEPAAVEEVSKPVKPKSKRVKTDKFKSGGFVGGFKR